MHAVRLALLIVLLKQPPVESPSASAPNGNAVQQPPTQSAPSPHPAEAVPYTATQTNGTSAPQQTQQTLPQYPPGVKAPSSEITPPGLVGTPQQQPPGARPTSTAPQQVPTQQSRPNVPSGFLGSLGDLVASFEHVKSKGKPCNIYHSRARFDDVCLLRLFPYNATAPARMSHLDQLHKLLEGSYSSMPQPQDTEKCVNSVSILGYYSLVFYRPKYYVPKHPINTPSYYPQTPSPILNTPAIFSQLDVETLFYVFYFHPGTYQQ